VQEVDAHPVLGITALRLILLDGRRSEQVSGEDEKAFREVYEKAKQLPFYLMNARSASMRWLNSTGDR